MPVTFLGHLLLFLGPKLRIGAFLLTSAFSTVYDSGLLEVLSAHLHFDDVSNRNLNKMFAQLSGNMGKNLMTVLKLRSEHGTGQDAVILPSTSITSSPDICVKAFITASWPAMSSKSFHRKEK